MGMLRRPSTTRRTLIGAACGAAIAGLVHDLLGGGPGVEPGERAVLRAVTLLGAFSLLGGLAGGCLGARSWRLFAGAALGAAASAGLGVVATGHIKGVIFALLGVPVGAVIASLRDAAGRAAEAGIRDGDRER